MRKAILAIGLLAMWLVPSLSAQETYQYVERRGTALYMDVYRPAEPRADKACVVYLFGGGFYAGERNDTASRVSCRKLSEQGFVTISIDYRLGLKGMKPDDFKATKVFDYFDTSIYWAVEDCSAAIAYIVKHAEELGIDPQKILLTGSSAGAVTVLQTDYCRANGRAEAYELPQGWKPAGVIPYAGAISVSTGTIKYKTPPAPTCFFHGTKDKIVFYKQFHFFRHRFAGANYLVKHLFKKNRYPYWVLRFEGRGHEVAGYLPDTIEEFMAFANAALKGRVTYYDARCEDEALQPNKWTNMTIFDLYLH